MKTRNDYKSKERETNINIHILTLLLRSPPPPLPTCFPSILHLPKISIVISTSFLLPDLCFLANIDWIFRYRITVQLSKLKLTVPKQGDYICDPNPPLGNSGVYITPSSHDPESSIRRNRCYWFLQISNHKTITQDGESLVHRESAVEEFVSTYLRCIPGVDCSRVKSKSPFQQEHPHDTEQIDSIILPTSPPSHVAISLVLILHP